MCFKNSKEIALTVTTSETDKKNSKYESKQNTHLQPLSEILRIFLRSEKLKGTIHTITVNYLN